MRSVIYTLLLAVLISGCGDDPEVTSSSNTSSSSGIISSIDKAVGSMSIFTAPSKMFELNYLNAPNSCFTNGQDGGPSAIDYHCSASGEPLKAANESGQYCQYTPSDETYVSEIFYCSVIFNTASPDSLRGAITLSNLIECSLRNADYFDFSDGDDENTGSVTIDLTTRNTCFSNFTYTDPNPDDGASTNIGAYISSKMSEESESVTANVVVKNLSSGDWDYEITFTLGSNSLIIKLKDSSSIVAASFTDSDEVWSVSVNQSTGVMSFETVDTSNNRRRRTMVNGTFSDDGALDLTKDVALEAWILEQCKSGDTNCDTSGDNVGWYEFTSIEGTYTASSSRSVFKQVHYTNGTSGGFSKVMDGVCNTGTSSDCDSITGIMPSESDIQTLNDATSSAFSSMSSAKPLLNYSTVDLSNTPWTSL